MTEPNWSSTRGLDTEVVHWHEPAVWRTAWFRWMGGPVRSAETDVILLPRVDVIPPVVIHPILRCYLTALSSREPEHGILEVSQNDYTQEGDGARGSLVGRENSNSKTLFYKDCSLRLVKTDLSRWMGERHGQKDRERKATKNKQL